MNFNKDVFHEELAKLDDLSSADSFIACGCWLFLRDQ
jgi:hypothetical protein